MRLSWYADTGVAVFSIWQAGMCTGTFRLPIGDLSRMIELLERGPSPQGRGRAPVSGARGEPERGRGGHAAGEDEISLLDSTSGQGEQAGYAGAEYTANYGRSSQGHGAEGGPPDYAAPDYGSAGYGDDSYGNAGYADASHAGASHTGASHAGASYGYGGGAQQADDRGTGGYQPADYGAARPDGHDPGAYEYDPAGYSRGGYAEDDSVRRGGQADADYTQGGYGAGATDYLTGEHASAGYHDAVRAETGTDYLAGGYGSQPAFPAGGHRRDDSRFPHDTGGLPSAETDGTGYHEERFVPPYVHGAESYVNENRARAAGYEGDPDYAGYPADEPSASPPEGYQEGQWPGEAYSYGSEYRRR
jgi:hypothetical protein